MVLVDATPEDDFKYMVGGVEKAGLEMTYQDWQKLFAERLTKAQHLEPWTEALEPFNRLPADLQRARVWAINQWFAGVDFRTLITAESWNREFVALRRLRLAQPYVLGDLPLVVLHRGRRSDASLDQREAELAKMSRAGEERIARESDHAIQLYQPELVIKAIHDMANKAALK